MGYAAEIFVIFYSQWDYQMVNISKILKFLTWLGFDEFGWNDPITNRNKISKLLTLNEKVIKYLSYQYHRKWYPKQMILK